MNWIKRTIIIFTAVLLFASAATTSFAAPSPHHNSEPTVIVEDGKMLIWTWFQEKDTILYESDRAAMDAAYSETKQAEGNLDDLVPGVSTKAAEVGVTLSDCKVSDLFDLTAYKKENGTWVKDPDRGQVTMKNTSYRFNNFVCLLHRKEGKWEIVDNAKVENNDTIEFTVSSLSPFAIVSWGNSGVGTGNKQSPKTGDNTIKWAAAATAGVLMIAATAYILLNIGKKRDK